MRWFLITSGVLVSASLLTCWWYSATSIADPTEQEYAVYTALLPHIAEGKKRIVVQRHTSVMDLPAYDSFIPSELKVKKVKDVRLPDFEEFCGRCEKDFVNKNLRAWTIQPKLEYSPNTRNALGHDNDDESLVTLSRVGLNIWHTRAVVMFSADCSDSASSNMCLEVGQAYLKRQDRKWILDRVSGNIF